MKIRLKSLFATIVALLFLTALISSPVKAQQSKIEIGFNYGFSNFLGDLGGNAGKGLSLIHI